MTTNISIPILSLSTSSLIFEIKPAYLTETIDHFCFELSVNGGFDFYDLRELGLTGVIQVLNPLNIIDVVPSVIFINSTEILFIRTDEEIFNSASLPSSLQCWFY